jgi:hypothetical protein
MIKNTVIRKILSTGLATWALPLLLLSPSAANAAPIFGVDYYVSPPLVQGTYATTGLTQITFDSATINQACPSDLTPEGSAVTVSLTGICNVQAGGQYGGATSTSGTPAFGGTRSNYANVGAGLIGEDTNGATFSFSTPQVYMGIWWSAGSAQNKMIFFNGEDEVLSLTTADLFAQLGAAPSGSHPWESTGDLEAVDGSLYKKHHYFGHPFGHTASPPAGQADPGEPFLFLHVFGNGGLVFDSVRLEGGGFEFDNLVVSSIAQTPASNLVLAGGIEGTPPEGPASPVGTATAQPSAVLASTGGGASLWQAVFVISAVLFGVFALALSRRKVTEL